MALVDELQAVPFGGIFYRYGEYLVNRVFAAIFNPNNAFRSTKVFICNHSPRYLYQRQSEPFEQGAFSPGQFAPPVLEPKSIHSYSVESTGGPFFGVAGANVLYSLDPVTPYWTLKVVTSNPVIGAASAQVQGWPPLTLPNPVYYEAIGFVSAGNNNEVNVDFYERIYGAP
jgi:hypothetical protein